MTLATRCSACGTVFRAAQDQLRASDGWVRCGRCDNVFNAAEVLFDIETGAVAVLDGLDQLDTSTPGQAGEPDHTTAALPHAALPPARSPQAPSLHGHAEPGFDDLAGPFHPSTTWPDPDLALPDPLPSGASVSQREEPLLRAPSSDNDDTIHIIDQQPPPPSALALDALDGPLGRLVGLDGVMGQTTMGATQHVASNPQPAPAAASHAGQIHSGSGDASTVARSAAARSAAALSAVTSAAVQPAALAQSLPSFLQTADRNAWWQRPAVRAGTAVAAVLLGLAALLQSALLAHDRLAAHLPATEPALRALCRVAGCQLQPLRRLDALSVGSSGLNRVEGSALYRLQLVLHNRADTAVMVPALELSLTDPQGQLVSRRVLQWAELADLGVAQTVLKPGQDVPIKVLMAAGAQRIDGYTVDLFYP